MGSTIDAHADTNNIKNDNLSTALESSHIFGYAKAMYVGDDKKGGRLNQSTLGFGGKIGIETGNYYGLSLKGAWYTTQDFGLNSTNPKKVDAYMFNLNKKPYSIIGESQIQLRFGKNLATLGRQEISSPLIDSYEYRIIPNLFQGLTLTSKQIDDATLTAAYISKMSGLDGLASFSDFRSMSQQAYTSLMLTPGGVVDAKNGETIDLSKITGNHGVIVAGFAYKKEYAFQFWNYYGINTLNTFYFDGNFKHKINHNLLAGFDFQAYRVSAVGKTQQYLAQHHLNADYWLSGVKTMLNHSPSGWGSAFAYNQFTGNKYTVTANGNWGGYPEFVGMPYVYPENQGVSGIARSHLKKWTITLDLSPYGLKDKNFIFGHARINLDESILAGSDIIVNSLIYKAKFTPQLSTRMAIEARNSGNARYNNKFIAMSLRYDF
ncbi:MAG: OprD family porin [Burkholderiaceae bacterium]|nr:OprD family porin [Burkholderiaceae bacterium]